MKLNPFAGFLGLLFILMTCASIVAMVSGVEGLTTLFTFVPRWEGRRCGPEPVWQGPNDFYPDSAPKWDFVTYEGFMSAEEKDASYMTESANSGKDTKMSSKIPGDPILVAPPNRPSPVDFANRDSYLLLSDELKTMPADSGISCVNSRSCFAGNFDRLQEKTGNFRQLTNNYKRGYPDSCSSPFQELVLSFYDSKGLKVDAPKNCI
jgi:hypothetical protein